MEPLPNAFAYAVPGDSPAPAADALPEERWPLGLSFVFVVSSSILLWLPIIALIRWLLGYG